MFGYLVFSVVLTICAWIWIKWRNVKHFWAKRNVPYNKPHPIMGSLTFLQKENPATFMNKIYQQFYGSPYVGIWLFWRPGLVVNSPELARNILVKHADVFRNRFLSSGKTDPVGGLNIFTVNDPFWSSMRRRLTFVFTAAKLKALQGMVLSKSIDLVERFRAESKKGPVTDVRNILSDYTTDIIGEAAFGVASYATRNGDSVIRKITKEFMHFNTMRGLSWSSIFFFPEMVDVFGFTLFPKSSVEVLRYILQSMIRTRGEDRDLHDPKDLLDALIKIKKEAEADGEEMSEDKILAQAAVFLLGGFDTSGSALSWTILELANHPLAQERLHQEILDAKEQHGVKTLDSAMLASLPYLNAVLKETLRKFPPMGWLDRIASQDYKVDDNLTIPAGTVVYVNAVGLHRDPAYYPDPDRFDPDRFLPENEQNIKPFTFIPFGDGPRNCIGMRFAYQTMRYALAAVVSNFVLKSHVKAEDISYEKKGLFLVPGEKISIRLEPREN